jgi:type II secretory pathway component PulK
MKKLSVNEMNVLSIEISKKVNEKKYEKIKGKLERDSDYKKLEKLSKEINDLNNKVKEKNKLYSEIVLKVRNKFNINNVYKDNNGEIKVIFGDNINVYNDLVLYSIGKEINVEELINKVVEKYS